MSRKLTKDQFIIKAREKHGDLYRYDDRYIGTFIKIRIYCKICEDYFEQSPNAHISGSKGQGCPVCNNIKISNKEVINNLTIEEDPIEVDNEIQCRCTYCKEYFKPTRSQLSNRIKSLSGKTQGERRLYCSNTCRNICPIYHKSKYYDDSTKPDTSRPDQDPLRRLTLERDQYTCQRCGTKNTYLICHHFEGIEINPIESADLDNCITLCYSCHTKVHSSGQCDVRRKPCSI